MDQEKAEQFLEKLAAGTAPLDKQRLSVLFRDFAVGAVSGAKRYPNLSQIKPNTHTVAIGLGLCTSADDLDDVDWSVLTHPGSIIWPVAVALGIENKLSLAEIFEAAAFGYQTGASFASMMGPAHRAKQHLTATSGAFAATAAATSALGLDVKEKIKAFKLTAANIGGSSRAGFERQGATQFNRVAAISLGLTSAYSAKLNAANVDDIWSGPFGLIEFNGAEAQNFEIKDGISTTSIRLYPLTGFAHSALSAAMKISPKLQTEIDEIIITLPAGIKGIMDGTRGGNWWNPISGISAYFASNDPHKLDDDSKYRTKTRLEFDDLPTGSGKVKVKAGGAEFEEYVQTPPGLIFDDQIQNKWKSLIGKVIESDEAAYNLCSSFPDLALR